ncbi:DUF2946 domain-containing protein [Pseudomonas sp. PS01302]|uniref:DUF2946 domain-containing protein n=1 Tax=Pseudomonas sp. PS01302 TaxID=2991438 RepID=UPI00249B8E6D|nr:DUF2946 domain-containing protein [Pseudomonas sp. PS01302]
MRKQYLAGAWLSLFAMLMIFAGPLISQGISLGHGKSHPMSMAGMECHDMTGMIEMTHHALVEKHHDLIVWEKCGYCSLLFQHPALTESTLPHVRLRAPTVQYSSTRFVPEQALPPIFPGARSRAPPLQPLNATSHFC